MATDLEGLLLSQGLTKRVIIGRIGYASAIVEKKTIARQDHLKNGSHYSCGCAQREAVQNVNKKHGYYLHPLYKKWQGMVGRCYRKNHKHYSLYGERGITICDEWRSNPESFVNWSLKNGWRDGLEIDRIDNDHGYNPENVRFVSHSENMKNRRSCIYIEIDGKKMTMKDASNLPGAVCYSTIRRRIKSGWTGKQAVFGKGRFHAITKSKYAETGIKKYGTN